MDKELYENFEKMADWQLMDFVTERESSTRRHAAMHILEKRRAAETVRATKSAARAAWWSAVAAIVSAAGAIVTIALAH